MSKIYGVSEQDAINFVNQAYVYFLRYDHLEVVRVEPDGVVVKILFVNDPENSTKEEGRFIYESMQSYVYDTCGSIYSHEPCSDAFGIIPYDTVQKGAPTKYTESEAPDSSFKYSFSFLLLCLYNLF